MIDLSLKICLEQSNPDNCVIDLPILQNAKLLKPICNWNMGFHQAGMSEYILIREISLVVVLIVYPMLPVSLDCPFLFEMLVVYNVYLYLK